MSSILDRLDIDVRLPFDREAFLSKDPIRLADAQYELINTLQDLLDKITIAMNHTIDLLDGEAVYYALKGSAGEYPDGTWRRIQVGDNLEEQVKIDGTWTLAQQVVRP